MSDTVPDRYRDSATRVDTGPELTPQQREGAETEPRGRRSGPRKTPGAAVTKPTWPATHGAGATGSADPTGAAHDPGSSDCAELLRRYRESQECFAPYRMANGGLRPEAFQLCGPDLPDPSGQCVQVNPRTERPALGRRP